MDVAVRRALLTGMGQLTGQISRMNGQALGTDRYEVDWHPGARPDHVLWQGRVWTYQQLVDVCGLGTGAGLLGWNCRHTYYPFIDGISVRNYPDEWLAEMDRREAVKVRFRGREYNTYEATQKQRQMETAMRAQREKAVLLKEGGADPDEVTIARCKYQAMLDEYKAFSKKMKLPQQRERIYADLRGRVAPSKRTYQNWKAGQMQKGHKGYMSIRERAENARREDMDNAVKSDIIKALQAKEETGVHLIGKINREIYKCVTADIVTDEVIITDNQIQHIKDRHPNDYERFSQYLRKIIEEPDYILEANKPNTAFVLKSIEDQGSNFQLILRLKTSDDPENYKNSVITFLKIDRKKWEKYLRNKKILYRRE